MSKKLIFLVSENIYFITFRYYGSDGSGSKWGWAIFLLLWLGLKISPKIPNFSIFIPSGQKKYHRVGSKNTWVKDGSPSYLMQVKSMVGSGPSLKIR